MSGYDDYAFEKLPKKKRPVYVAVGNYGKPGDPNIYSNPTESLDHAFGVSAAWRDQNTQAAVYRDDGASYECVGPFDEEGRISPLPHIRTANL